MKEISLYNVEGEYNFWTAKEYVDLRDSTISSRLTLFNARRGGEQTRLLLSEWEDAVNNVTQEELRSLASLIVKYSKIRR